MNTYSDGLFAYFNRQEFDESQTTAWKAGWLAGEAEVMEARRD